MWITNGKKQAEGMKMFDFMDLLMVLAAREGKSFLVVVIVVEDDCSQCLSFSSVRA